MNTCGWVIPKSIIKIVQTATLHGMQALGQECDNAALLYIGKRPGTSVWNCLQGHAL